MISYRSIILITIILSSFNCADVESDETKIKYENFKSEGQIENASYIFCSYVPQEIHYTYRVGLWTFTSSNGYKIAEGIYDKSIKTIDTVGGCSFDYIKNTVNLKKWQFWNKKGELIRPNQKMINLIQPNQFKTDDLFENID